jgi:hypothetical protein
MKKVLAVPACAERFTASMQHAVDKFGGRSDATTTRAESG